MALPSIEQVDLGLAMNHMLSEHTLQHFRANLWLPQLVDRSGWNGPASDRALLDKAQARINALLAGYHKPEGRADYLARMRQVIERARRALYG
jgi:trimethylamine:corrinoid methyltransferase-like protein